MMPIFITERLTFREFTSDDAGLIYELNADPEVTRYVHEPATTPEVADHLIQNIILPHYKLYHHGRWAVHIKDDNKFIGWCGLKYIPEKDHVDLGYRFVKASWGKGYATEAASGCIAYGFDVLDLHRIFAMAHIDNLASQNVLEKCGMYFIGEDTADGCRVRTYELLNPRRAGTNL